MNAIFWGADRLESLKALDYLVKNGVTVLACVCDSTQKDFYYNRQNLIEDKRIKPGDSLEEINRKIEAFWFSPYEGATIELNGETFTLVNSTILNKIAQNALGDGLEE